MSEAGFIPDGYTLRGYIAAVAGIHCALRFEYRPTTSLENKKVLEGAPSEEVSEERFRKMLAEKIVSWDMTNPKECKVVPVTVENMGRIQPKLRSTLVDIVMGWKSSDPAPSGTPQPDPQPQLVAEQGNSAGG